jgi:eukaryotic-like serine/threonine-protein kinase
MAPSWARVKEVVGGALDLEHDERESSVRRICGDDMALQTEVQSLLLAIAQSGSFIESTALESLTWRALQPGEAFGAYEVLDLLGAGGMGDVYRAHDTRLNRHVALKVPSGHLTLDSDRLARLTREAHVLAALNHPHIAAIYGFEEPGGTHALVLELVEGPTLADVIARGPIPVTEALPIVRQIAEGVRAAHQQGIVHRDLKPSNIKLRPDGMVKILDFGLARVLDDLNSSSIGATVVNRAICDVAHPSAMFGTAAYMSPEQAEGNAADERSDIWAFGCVLYETLTGRQAFGGETPDDALAAARTSEPDWQLLPAWTPDSVQRVLRRCLEKDPARRLQDIAEALSAFDEGTSRTPGTTPARRLMFGVLLGSMAVATVVSISNYVRPTTPAPATMPAVRRLLLGLPGTQPLARAASMPLGTGQASLALSPDGTRVAYVFERAGMRQLYLRALDQPEGQPVPHTEGAHGPFFSPDGRWVGFFRNNQLAKIAASGGAATVLADAPNPFGGSWGADGTILFAVDEGRRLMTLPATGAEPRRVDTKDTNGSWTAVPVTRRKRGNCFTSWQRRRAVVGVWRIQFARRERD